jgi:hypothetical protein
VAARGARAASAGFLDVRKGSGWSNYFDAFVQRLQELGWIERKSVVIERRWAEGRSERCSEIASEFIRLDVAVIVTGGIAVRAARAVMSGMGAKRYVSLTRRLNSFSNGAQRRGHPVSGTTTAIFACRAQLCRLLCHIWHRRRPLER